MGFWNFGDLRTLLATETDNDSPGSEELISQIRENIEALFMLLLSTGVDGTATSDPSNDANGYFYDTAAGYADDEHNGRTLLITSGSAIGNTYTIDDTVAASDRLACTGDNLYADGVRSGDAYLILFDLKSNQDGHDHDGINSSVPVLGAASIVNSKLKTAGANASGTVNFGVFVGIQGQDYCFAPNIYTAHSDVYLSGYGSSNADYVMRLGLYNNSVDTNAPYAVYYRYITSSDQPFVYVIQKKKTGEVLQIWAAEDPPPQYWGCKATPEHFVPPIVMAGKPDSMGLRTPLPLPEDCEEVICWQVEKDVFDELMAVMNNAGHEICKRVGERFEFAEGKVLRRKGEK